MVSLAFISYNQQSLIISYIIIIIYSFGRSYHWINDNFRYARFNIFVITMLIVIYIFSRASHKRERKIFEQSNKQKQLLKLFYNLIRVYHDGILITHKEDILYSNKAIDKIFNESHSYSQSGENDDNEMKSPLRKEIPRINASLSNKQILSPQTKNMDLINQIKKAHPKNSQKWKN